MRSELMVLDPSVGLKAKTWCVKGEGGGGILLPLLQVSSVEKTSMRRSGYGGSVLFMDKRRGELL